MFGEFPKIKKDRSGGSAFTTWQLDTIQGISATNKMITQYRESVDKMKTEG